ncbi:N-acetylglucosamine-6-phosphate deacetylase [Clostridiales bacterium COT073_COT-073]|nr:N-acetylglucosamine-6-phosphate deacetylase [Clostridiales bacterium COT073_COT-073]
MKAIINGQIYTDNHFCEGKVLLFDQTIKAIIDKNEWDGQADQILDAAGAYVVPGFIDVHIHGFNGADVMDGKTESLTTMAKGLTANGVTSFLATTMTMGVPYIRAALEAVKNYTEDEQLARQGAEIVGVHLEGPFININKKGAQRGEDIIPADINVIAGYEDLVKVITIAPEVPENMAFIEKYADRFNFSIGHTEATYEVASEAVKKGARSVTHLFNAMSPLEHRFPGVVGTAFLEDIYAELIADTIHVHKKMFEMIYKLKGANRLILITDAMRGAGMPEGRYDLGGQEVIIKDGRCLLIDGVLAGSVLKLNDAVRHFTENTTIGLEKVIPLATLTPATYIGVQDRKGSLDAGKDADIVFLDKDLKVLKTIARGDVKYEV